MSEAKSADLSVRVTPEVKRLWNEKASEKAQEFGGAPSDVLRSLVIAFCEGRVTVHPRPM